MEHPYAERNYEMDRSEDTVPLQASHGYKEEEVMRLIRSVILMRHGMRRTFSGTRFHNGQLTGRGRKLCFDLGTWFRRELEEKGMTFEEVPHLCCASSPSPRAAESVKAFAEGFTGSAGMTGPAQGWSPEFFIPALSGMTDGFRRTAEQQVLHNTDAAGLTELPLTLDENLSVLKRLTGKETDDGNTELILEEGKGPVLRGPLSSAARAADRLLCRDINQHRWKQHLSEADRAALAGILDLHREVLFGTEAIVRSSLGPFLRQLRRTITAEDQQTCILLSAHDTTIQAVLTALGVPGADLPGSTLGTIPFGSCLCLEVYEDEQHKFIDIQLVRPHDAQIDGLMPVNPEHSPQKMKIPDCITCKELQNV